MSNTASTSNSSHLSSDHLLALARRLLVWSVFLAVLYLLRSFFLLIFLTFVFSYIQSRAVNRLAGRIRNRPIRVIMVGLVFLAALVMVGHLLFPSVAEQTRIFASNYTNYMRTIDRHLLEVSGRYPMMRNLIPVEWPESPARTIGDWSPESSPSAQIFQAIFGMGEKAAGSENLKSSLDTLKGIGKHLITSISAFLLSLLFSFLIVLDLPRLTSSIRDLENTRLKFICTEVSASIFGFGSVLGRVLEAQFFIAILNTILTAIGLYLLSITSKIAFLSMIVFLCSFIPIAGVFISSIPICLIALETGGLTLFFLAILLITVIHLIEAYILNPRIYGHHLRMNPVLVLMVLTIGGKLFGVWGLILALPACRYFFGRAIRYGQH